MSQSEKKYRKLGKAAKFYRLTPDPEGCHDTKVEHVIAKLEGKIKP